MQYIVIVEPTETGYSAYAPDLPGCVGGGDTIMEALEMLEDAKLGWLTSRLKHGDPIPEPSASVKHSAA